MLLKQHTKKASHPTGLLLSVSTFCFGARIVSLETNNFYVEELMKKLITSSDHALRWSLVPIVFIGAIALGILHLFWDGAKYVVGMKK